MPVLYQQPEGVMDTVDRTLIGATGLSMMTLFDKIGGTPSDGAAGPPQELVRHTVPDERAADVDAVRRR
jgi:hypothetical protein